MGLMDIVPFHDSSTPETVGLFKKNEYAGSSWSSCFGILGEVVHHGGEYMLEESCPPPRFEVIKRKKMG